MATGRKIVVEFLGDDKSLSRAANQAESRMGKFGGKLKSLGKVAGLGFAAGIGLAAKGLYDVTKAAAEDQAGQAKLAQALKNTAGATDDQIASTEDWITAQGKALGVADDDLRPALARLASATGDVGKAQDLASLAMDVSAGSGKSLESVSTALMKAANGQVSSLSRLGINTKNAKGETISFEQAQKRMAQTFKGQAEKNAETLSGKMARLKLMLGEAGEEIGAKLIPIITKLADWFINKALPSIEAFGDYLKITLPPVFAKIQAVIAKFTGDGSGKFSKFIADVKGIFNDGVTIVTRLWELFGKNIVQFLTSTVKNLFQILKGAFKIIRGIFKVFSSLLKGDWKGAWKGIQLILSGAKDILIGMVKQLGNLLRFAFKNIGVALKAIFGNIWDGIKNLAARGIEWLVDKVRALPGQIRDLGGAFLSAGKWLIDKFFDGLKALGTLGANVAAGLMNGIIDPINTAIRAINDAIPDSIGFSVAGKDVGFNLPNDPFPEIPRLAKGGIVKASRGGTLALIGEGGHDEAVVPLSGPHAPRGMGGGDTHIHIHGVVDKLGAAREIEKLMIQLARANGRPLQFPTR